MGQTRTRGWEAERVKEELAAQSSDGRNDFNPSLRMFLRLNATLAFSRIRGYSG